MVGMMCGWLKLLVLPVWAFDRWINLLIHGLITCLKGQSDVWKLFWSQDPDTATALAAAAGVKAPAQAEPSDPTEVYVSNTSEAVAQSHLQEFFCMIGELESVTKQGLVPKIDYACLPIVNRWRICFLFQFQCTGLA